MAVMKLPFLNLVDDLFCVNACFQRHKSVQLPSQARDNPLKVLSSAPSCNARRRQPKKSCFHSFRPPNDVWTAPTATTNVAARTHAVPPKYHADIRAPGTFAAFVNRNSAQSASSPHRNTT